MKTKRNEVQSVGHVKPVVSCIQKFMSSAELDMDWIHPWTWVDLFGLGQDFQITFWIGLDCVLWLFYPYKIGNYCNTVDAVSYQLW